MKYLYYKETENKEKYHSVISFDSYEEADHRRSLKDIYAANFAFVEDGDYYWIVKNRYGHSECYVEKSALDYYIDMAIEAVEEEQLVS